MGVPKVAEEEQHIHQSTRANKRHINSMGTASLIENLLLLNVSSFRGIHECGPCNHARCDINSFKGDATVKSTGIKL